MKFSIITIFPKLFDSFLSESLIAKALAKKKIEIEVFDLRAFATDKHHTVDDSPYGGGPGMVMKVDVWFRALEFVVGKKELARRYQKIPHLTSPLSTRGRKKSGTKIILLDPAGRQFTQGVARKYADTVDHLVLGCGRYEGFDHRITKLVDERISIGPYVLNGGEVAAQVITEAVFRLIPGTIGNPKSLDEETHSTSYPSRLGRSEADGLSPCGGSPVGGRITNYAKSPNDFVEYPQYTRPAEFSPHKKISWPVPKILLSGDHKKIATWRNK